MSVCGHEAEVQRPLAERRSRRAMGASITRHQLGVLHNTCVTTQCHAKVDQRTPVTAEMPAHASDLRFFFAHTRRRSGVRDPQRPPRKRLDVASVPVEGGCTTRSMVDPIPAGATENVVRYSPAFAYSAHRDGLPVQLDRARLVASGSTEPADHEGGLEVRRRRGEGPVRSHLALHPMMRSAIACFLFLSACSSGDVNAPSSSTQLPDDLIAYTCDRWTAPSLPRESSSDA